MKIGGVGNLCLWCMEEMGESSCCPYCGHDERVQQRAEQAIPAGQIIGGHYLIGRTLGQGGFGITYLAYDLDLHIKRAIKEYFPQGLVTRVGNTVQVTRQSVLEVYQKGVDSFYREAQSIARFGGHPNVVQVHAFFRENNSAYFVMDYVEGISFKQYLEDRGGRVSWEEALRILKPIGEALTALHEAHLLHRDVKPDNIFITRNGTPKLLDFGAARYETSETTHSSAAVLTPGYAPVEQYGSMSRQGTYTDVYALSATFYRAVSGVVPIPAPDRMTEDPLLPLNKVDGRVPAGIGAALSHGMGVRSEKRTQSVAELLKELESPSSRKSASKLSKWLLPALAAVAILALGLGLGLKLRNPGAGEKQSEPVQEFVDLAGTAEALALTKVKESEIPTDTPEPTADRTAEYFSFRETGFAETEALWNMRMETEAARPTETPKPTATKVPTATRTQKPTATVGPVSVSGLKAEVSGQKIRLSWDKVPGVNYYSVYYSLFSDYGFKSVGTSRNSFMQVNLKGGTTYYFKVSAKLSDGTYSEDSAVIPAVIPVAATKTPMPTATRTQKPTATVGPVSVSGLKAEVSGQKIRLSWDKVPGVNYYSVYYSLFPNYGFKSVGTSRNSFMQVNLKGGTTYYFKVSAKLSDGTYSEDSAVIPAVIPVAATKTPMPMATATVTVKAQGVITDEIRNAQVGDHVYYGQYEQDNDLSNGAEEIEWRVLAREGNRVLLLSEYGLDAKAYNDRRDSITWEKSTLRSWLNGEFYKSAFNAEEQAQIAIANVKAEKNPSYSTNPGNNTKDRIFLLSISEANTYFNDKTERECKVTDYAEARGAYRYGGDGIGWWWLRSPGRLVTYAARVSSGGSVDFYGSHVDGSSVVARPALWLNL